MPCNRLLNYCRPQCTQRARVHGKAYVGGVTLRKKTQAVFHLCLAEGLIAVSARGELCP